MNLNKSTRYALYAAMEMAQTGSDRVITVGDVAARYRIPEGALAKVFQQLVRAGIAYGTRGIGGGYRLARPASDLTVLEIINVFEPSRAPGQCLLADRASECGQSPACRIRRLFDEVDGAARHTFASITLATLVK